MENKGIGGAAAIVIIIIIAAAGVGAYVLVSGDGEVPPEGEEEEEEVPPEGEGIGGATSLDFKVDTTNGVTMTCRFRAREIGTGNMDIRVDCTSAENTVVYILSGSQGKAWTKMDGEWMEIPYFDVIWQNYINQMDQYMDELSGWTIGDWTYTDPATGASVRIYDIQVNPSLPDSLFQPS